MEYRHTPVMLKEVIEYLITDKSGIYIDATVGGGGHSAEILKALSPDSTLMCFDQDNEALTYSKKYLETFPQRKIFIHSNYSKIKFYTKLYGFEKKVNGILFDLGLSSYQIDNPERGFSYMNNSPLDMRMNNLDNKTAYNVINEYSKEELEKVLINYGEEKNYKKIVNSIIEARKEKPIQTSKDLVSIISKITSEKFLIKTLSRVFQAIRIEVNNELEQLKTGINDAFDMLAVNGRLVIISYHSLEDRIVKHFIQSKTQQKCNCPVNMPICICNKKIVARKVGKFPLEPTEEEIKKNNRARSAKMRVVEKIEFE